MLLHHKNFTLRNQRILWMLITLINIAAPHVTRHISDNFSPPVRHVFVPFYTFQNIPQYNSYKMSEKVIIAVNEGKVRGIKQSSTFSKAEYYSFFGIPYAEQPVGNLRFQVFIQFEHLLFIINRQRFKYLYWLEKLNQFRDNLDQDPVKVKPWKSIYDATKQKPGCVQFSLITFEFCGTEDCLFNNIFTPKVSTFFVGSIPSYT